MKKVFIPLIVVCIAGCNHSVNKKGKYLDAINVLVGEEKYMHTRLLEAKEKLEQFSKLKEQDSVNLYGMWVRSYEGTEEGIHYSLKILKELEGKYNESLKK